MSIRIGCSDVVNGLNKSNSGRVCERMSCEESKVLFTFADIPHRLYSSSQLIFSLILNLGTDISRTSTAEAMEAEDSATVSLIGLIVK